VQTLFSLIIILALLLLFAAAKVLLRTNPVLGIGVIVGCGAFLILCWYIYPKINKP